MAVRATSLKAMFWADSLGVEALGEHDAPGQRLHAAQRTAHHGGEPFDAEAVGQARLGRDPVFHRHQREGGAIGLAGGRIVVHRAGRAEAGAEVVDADDEEAVGVDRLARAHHVVPPAGALRLVRVVARHVVGGVQRVADQHRVGLVRVQGAVGFIHQRVVADGGAALQAQRFGEVHRLG
jgi:hypothetical protein